jgi:three-Cys-motif partner protein
MITAGRDMLAADPRIEGRIGPGDFGRVAHRVLLSVIRGRLPQKAALAGICRKPISWPRTGTAALAKVRSIAPKHAFGGSHTDDKVGRLRAYLQPFTSALKHQGFELVYIDAFAGSGNRTDVIPVLPLLDGDNAEPQRLDVPGSARVAMEITPPFDRLYLVERDPERYAALETLAAEFPQHKITCYRDDANGVVQNLCRSLPWRKSNDAPHGMRGVIFLDPYGMEVHWATVQAIAATESLDLWYFFPLMGLYRQAANAAPSIDNHKREQLNKVLGTNDWERDWYGTPHGDRDLFDDAQTPIRMVDLDTIERYVKKRLQSEFKGAVLDPYRIHNAQGLPLASLFFAVSNPNAKAVGLATKIARHILRRPAKRSMHR